MTADKSGGAERSALQWASQTVRDLPPYKGPTTFSDYPDPARRPRLIHLNESPYPPSPRVAEAIAAAMHDLNRYPNIYGRDLVDAIARDAEMPAGRIVLGCGSDELIQLRSGASHLMPVGRAMQPHFWPRSARARGLSFAARPTHRRVA